MSEITGQSEIQPQSQQQQQTNQSYNQNQNQNRNQSQNRQQKKNTYAPKRGPIINLEPILNNQVLVTISNGAEITGKLTGYDQLMNLVVEDATIVKPASISKSGKREESKIAKIVIIGRLLMSLEPMDGYEVITNPNFQPEFVI